MTNIPQVNIWVEAEAFLDSITGADIALRIVAATKGAECTVDRARPWSCRSPCAEQFGALGGGTANASRASVPRGHRKKVGLRVSPAAPLLALLERRFRGACLRPLCLPW